VPPIRLSKTSGTFIFDRMLSWWSRHIGISPYFAKPVPALVEDGRIRKIEGGDEAEALRRFLASMVDRVATGSTISTVLHFGVHPQADIGPDQCPSVLYRRLDRARAYLQHPRARGRPPPTQAYPYWVHCTGDIRSATFRVGNTLVHDRGYLTALDASGGRRPWRRSIPTGRAWTRPGSPAAQWKVREA